MMAIGSPIANKMGLHMLAMPPIAHRDLIARLPLIGAKSLRIQNHDRSDDEREKLGREAQFGTGLAGTPYAVALPQIPPNKTWIWR
jgi:hypothetical protein